jgi:site-specific DNA recombinase
VLPGIFLKICLFSCSQHPIGLTESVDVLPDNWKKGNPSNLRIEILAELRSARISDLRTTQLCPESFQATRSSSCKMGKRIFRPSKRRWTGWSMKFIWKGIISKMTILGNALRKCSDGLPAGDIEKAVVEQLSAVFRTPTLVAKTYFAAREIESLEKERLIRQKLQLEEDLAQARQQAIELMKPRGDQPNKEEVLATVNWQAVDLSRQLTGVASRCRTYLGSGITEQDVSEAFSTVETFCKDLFPVERNRLIRLLVEKVEIRETGIDMELKINGLTTLITELAGLACEVNERRVSR